MKNVLFYKFIVLESLEELQASQFELCRSLNLKGKVLLGKEGINGCLSGADEDIQKYIDVMKSDSRFADVTFKLTPAHAHTFKKLFIRVRDQIVASSWNDNRSKTAPYIEPKELKSLLDKNEDVILIDMRNGYEYDIGHFKNAVKVPTETFRELPSILPSLEKYKQKKIVTYCTGGIRCEKATVLLRENGFENVQQLHGGIVEYGLELGNAHWDGKCFVFDQRGAIDIDPEHMSDPITICYWCRQPSAEYRNCAKLDCDKMFISCDSCAREHKSACSKKCRSHL